MRSDFSQLSSPRPGTRISPHKHRPLLFLTLSLASSTRDFHHPLLKSAVCIRERTPYEEPS
eukprot:1160393-Pelagomonas_calceolata.AAC.22